MRGRVGLHQPWEIPVQKPRLRLGALRSLQGWTMLDCYSYYMLLSTVSLLLLVSAAPHISWFNLHIFGV